MPLIQSLIINLNAAPAAAPAQVVQPLPQSYHKPAWQTCLEVAVPLASLASSALTVAPVVAKVWPW